MRLAQRLVTDRNRERAAWLWRRSKLHARALRHRYGVWRMRGPLAGLGRDLSLVAIGPPGFEIQLHGVFLDSCEQVEKVGEVGPLDDARTWIGPDDDVVAHVRRPWQRPGPDEIPMALALDTRIDLPTTPADHVARHLAENHRRAWKKRDDLGVTYSFANGAADLRHWYEHLYSPLTLLRHGARAHVHALEDFEPRLPRMELLLASIRGEVVAGALLEHDPWFGTLTRAESGALPAIAEGDPKLYKMLTVALEYRALERAHERGIRRYSMGFTLPRIDNGVFVYKRRWGASFVPFPWAWPTSLRFAPGRQAEILSRAPLLAQPGGEATALLGITAGDAAARAALVEQIRLAAVPNLRRVVVAAPPEEAPGVRAALAEEGVTGVVVEAQPSSHVTRPGRRVGSAAAAPH